MIPNNEIKQFLDEKYNLYNQPGFIETDPIQIPHRFTNNYDIEIAAFLTSTIAWGQRKSIINNASKLMHLLDNAPYDFISESTVNDIKGIERFVHRTFNTNDLIYFLHSLKNLYKKHKSLKDFFESRFEKHQTIQQVLVDFRNAFLEMPDSSHVAKHVSDVANNSAAKRLNMFLMWMVRNDNRGVHFGLWNKIPASALMIPLDVHVGNIARKLGLLTRNQNDWKAVAELTSVLRTFDPADPVKYDFALFGLGVFEKF